MIGDELMDDARTTEGFMSMKGGGYYSKATIGAKHVIDNAAHLIFDSLVTVSYTHLTLPTIPGV